MKAVILAFLSLAISSEHGRCFAADSNTTNAVVNAPSAHVLSRDLLAREVTKALREHFNVEGDLQVEPLTTLPRMGAGVEPWIIQIVEFPSVLSNLVSIRFKACSGNVVTGEILVNMRVQVWRDVFVAKEAIMKDSPFDVSLLDVRRVDVLKERNVVPVTSIDRDMVFRSPVAGGRLIQFRDLERRALVRKGELVEVIASDGMLTVKMKGMALQSGGAGDMITVRNVQSKKDITVLVIAENQTQVRF